MLYVNDVDCQGCLRELEGWPNTAGRSPAVTQSELIKKVDALMQDMAPCSNFPRLWHLWFIAMPPPLAAYLWASLHEPLD